jgi:hypothetical protein
MRQTTLCVPLEVKPESCGRLSELIDRLKQREDKGNNPLSANFERLIELVPSLHFMSMSVFPAAEYDPLFILEANFDGPPGPFWGQLEPVLGDCLRAILRCCKRPLDGDGALYDAVVRQGSSVLVAPYMEARTQYPSVFHHGNRGLARDRILGDRALFQDVCAELDKPPSPLSKHYHSLAPAELHAALRAATLPNHYWLNEPTPERITTAENLVDWTRAIAFVLAALMALSSPGLLLASLVRWPGDLLLMVVVCRGGAGTVRADLPQPPRPARHRGQDPLQCVGLPARPIYQVHHRRGDLRHRRVGPAGRPRVAVQPCAAPSRRQPFAGLRGGAAAGGARGDPRPLQPAAPHLAPAAVLVAPKREPRPLAGRLASERAHVA